MSKHDFTPQQLRKFREVLGDRRRNFDKWFIFGDVQYSTETGEPVELRPSVLTTGAAKAVRCG